MSNNVKHYRIAGMYWKQEELTYLENEQIKKVCGDILTIEELTTEKIYKLMELLRERGNIKQIMPIILKEDNFLHRKIFNLIGNKRGITRDNIVERMKDTQIFPVMLDFFDLSTRWMTNFFDTIQSSKSNQDLKRVDEQILP